MKRSQRVDAVLSSTAFGENGMVPGQRTLDLYSKEVQSAILAVLRRRWRTGGEVSVEASMETGLFETRTSVFRARITEVTVTAMGFSGLEERDLRQAFEEAKGGFDLSLMGASVMMLLTPKFKVVQATAAAASPA